MKKNLSTGRAGLLTKLLIEKLSDIGAEFNNRARYKDIASEMGIKYNFFITGLVRARKKSLVN